MSATRVSILTLCGVVLIVAVGQSTPPVDAQSARPAILHRSDEPDPDAASPAPVGDGRQEINLMLLDDAARMISFQALLTNEQGGPISQPNGEHELDFRLYDSEAGGVPIGMVLDVVVTLDGGVASTQVGPMDPTWFDGTARWMGVTVDNGDELEPLIPLGSVPYAFRVDRVASAELDDNIDLGDETTAGSLRVFNGETAMPTVIIDGPLSTIELFDSTRAGHFLGVSIDGSQKWVLVNGADGLRDAWLRSLPFDGASSGQLLLYDSTDNSRTVNLTARAGTGSSLSMYDTNEVLRSRLIAREAGGSLILHDSAENANLTLAGTGSRIDSLTTRLSLNAISPEEVTIAAGGGNVSIGHVNPQSLLHLASLGGIDLIIDADTNNIGEDQNARLLLRQDGGQVVARVGFREGDNSLEIMQEFDDSLILGTNNLDRMTITSSGNVGIGTNDPTTRLHVQGGNDGTDILVRDGQFARMRMIATDPASDVTLSIQARGSGGLDRAEIGTVSSHDLVLYSNGTVRIRIDSDGSVCIGGGC